MKLLRTMLVGAVFAAMGYTTVVSATVQPNILVIVADDLGYADTGFQGSKDIFTPNLDQLAASGIRFTQAYSAYQFCSPARAALLTGRYPQRYGVYRNPLYDLASHEQGLPTSETLLPEHLVRAGYKTGWVGKWHLGAAKEFTPQQRGFQESYGSLGGRHQYINWEPDIAVEDRAPLIQKGPNLLANLNDSFYIANRKFYRGLKPPAHITLAQGQAGAAFVRKHQKQPWFLYLAFNAPHTPHDPTPERLAKFAHIADPVRRAYAAQISLMDDAIGETITALQETGQRERTLVIFLSDNGGAQSAGANNAPLRRGKGSFYEGGIRVPFIMSWPAALTAGKVDDHMVSTMDVFATSLAIAGVPLPDDKTYDSVNLMPFLTGENSGLPHQQLFWGDKDIYVVREGKWKLIDRASGTELYNLERDVNETGNRVLRKPEQVAALKAAMDSWKAQMQAPAYIGEDVTRDHKQ